MQKIFKILYQFTKPKLSQHSVIQKQVYINTEFKYKKRLISDQNKRNCIIEVKNYKWDEIYKCEVNEAYNNLLNILQYLQGKYIPERKLNTKCNRKPWLTSEIKIPCEHKKIFYNKYREGFITKEYYYKYANVLKKL